MKALTVPPYRPTLWGSMEVEEGGLVTGPLGTVSFFFLGSACRGCESHAERGNLSSASLLPIFFFKGASL